MSTSGSCITFQTHEQGHPPPSTEPLATTQLPQRAVTEPASVTDIKHHMAPQSEISPSGTVVLLQQPTAGKGDTASATESHTPSEVDYVSWLPLQKGIGGTSIAQSWAMCFDQTAVLISVSSRSLMPCVCSPAPLPQPTFTVYSLTHSSSPFPSLLSPLLPPPPPSSLSLLPSPSLSDEQRLAVI